MRAAAPVSGCTRCSVRRATTASTDHSSVAASTRASPAPGLRAATGACSSVPARRPTRASACHRPRASPSRGPARRATHRNWVFWMKPATGAGVRESPQKNSRNGTLPPDQGDQREAPRVRPADPAGPHRPPPPARPAGSPRPPPPAEPAGQRQHRQQAHQEQPDVQVAGGGVDERVRHGLRPELGDEDRDTGDQGRAQGQQGPPAHVCATHLVLLLAVRWADRVPSGRPTPPGGP